MPVEIKQLAGIMDTDSSNEVMPPVFHKYAKNVRFRGDGKNTRVENIPGTTLVPNSFLPAGVNECIGVFYDEKKLRIFFFEWNSNGNHGIYIYYTQVGTFAKLLQVGGGTDGDVLGFTLQRYITSINVIYGGEADGDILFFLDSLKRPTKLNIDRYLAGTYTTVKRNYLKVIKAPPPVPAKVTYENDDNVTVNNLKNSLFQFIYRFWYDDNDKSVWSTGSIVPLPDAPFSYAIDTDVSKNSRISLYIETGDENVKKIEIACRQTKDGDTTDYFLLDALDKTDLSIADNGIYRFVFYNDGLYTFIDKTEGDLLFDYLPREANAQEILNGNVPIYGGIREGYDNVKPILLSTSNTTLFPYSTYNGVLFFAFKNATNQITLYLTGTGTNDGSGNAAVLSNPPARLYVIATDPAFADKSFTYVNASSNINTILSGIAATAVIKGFTVITSTANTVVLQLAGGVLLNSAGVVREPSSAFNSNETSFCYALDANYSFGKQYYDEDGRTNGVITAVQYQVKTQPLGSNYELPLIQLFISDRPPIWAAYYQLMRTNDLTYSKRLHWISKQANNGYSSTSTTRYAYVDVSNIAEYNEELKASEGVVTYSFAKGDRIKFIARRPPNAASIPLSGLDYEIVGTQASLKINGVEVLGNWVQIVYPSTDITSDFQFDGTTNFQNYEILLYAYKPHTNDKLNVYYEFGREYPIGNAGTVNAYHIGQEATQSVDLFLAAQTNTTEGDYFFRKRSVPTGLSYLFSAPAYTDGLSSTTVVAIPVPGTPIVTSQYQFTTQNLNVGSPLVGSPPTAASTQFIFQNLTGGGTLRLRIRASVTVANNVFSNDFQCYVKMVNNPVPVAALVLYDLIPIQHGLAIGTHTYTIDTTIDTYNGSKCFIQFFKTESSYDISAIDWNFEVLNNDDLYIVEKSFSDVYNIQTSSNSRPSVVDPNAKELFFPTLLRWGLAYEADTNINQSNRFFPLNFDEIDRARGDIQRLMVEARILYAYQNRAVGSLGIYAKFLQDSGNTNILTTTDNIITPNNVSYLLGEFGLGERPEGLCRAKSSHYFFDPIRGYWIRRAGDGLIPLNELYKGQFYIKNLITPYAKNWVTPNGGVAKILPFYDFFEEQCVGIFTGGTNGTTIQSYALSFNERRNGFTAFYDLYVDWITCAEDVTYSWKNGEMYIHNNTTNYTNFHGVQYYPSVTLNFNDKIALKKTFEALAYQSNQIWVSDTNGDVNTSQTNPQTGFPQISQLKSVDYEIQENVRYAALLRDANSMASAQEALVNGDVLKGVWIECKLTYKGSEFAYLYLPYIHYNNSPKNL